MTRKDLFTGVIMDTDTTSSEDLRQSLNGCSREWREAVIAELAARGESFTVSFGDTPWPLEAPVSPYPIQSSPWNSQAGTMARHEEEEDTIHGIN